MKKVLGILLVLAMAFSCFTAVYATDETDVLGAVLSIADTTGNKCNMTGKISGTTTNTTEKTPFKGIDFGTSESRTFKFLVYNGATTSVTFQASYGWAQIYTNDLTKNEDGTGKASASYAADNKKIEVGEFKTVELVIPSGVYWVNTQKSSPNSEVNFTVNDLWNGSRGEKVDGSGIGLRFNFGDANLKDAGNFYITCVESDSVTAEEAKQINKNLTEVNLSTTTMSAITDWNADEGTKAIKAELDKLNAPAGGDEGDDAGAGSEETATPTPTPTPKVITGVKFTFNEEYDGEYWFISSSTGGVVSAANVKDGTLTKTVTVKNNGKEDITVAFYLEALVSGQWKHPVGNDSVVVEPGKAEVITYECDVEDGNVSILDEDVAIEKLFFRFNVVGADGEKVLPEGTSFTIYSSESDSEKLLAGATVNKDAAVREYVYDSPNGSVGTGDVLPVAFIALTVVASVALIVVCKKKREEL